MKLYSVDIQVAATAYIRAENEKEALEIAKSLKHDVLEVSDLGGSQVEISDKSLDDLDLPDVSLSTMMTVHGPFPDAAVEEAE